MKKELNQLIEVYMKKEGVSLKSGIRDAITDLFHIARNNNLNIKEIVDGATNVFEQEKAICRCLDIKL